MKFQQKKNQNTLWTWHKYVLNYWQIENNRLLGSVPAQPPLWQDVNKTVWRRTKPRRRWAIHQRGMPGRQEGTNWGRKPRRTARVLRRFLSSLCSTSLILTSPCQHWVNRFLPSLFSTSLISTHCIALVVQETDQHLEDGADSSSDFEEVFAIFCHS